MQGALSASLTPLVLRISKAPFSTGSFHFSHLCSQRPFPAFPVVQTPRVWYYDVYQCIGTPKTTRVHQESTIPRSCHILTDFA